MRSNVCLRLREQVDQHSFQLPNRFSINLQKIRNSSQQKNNMNKSPNFERYQITKDNKLNSQTRKTKQQNIRKSKKFHNSVEVSLEMQQPIKTQEKSLYYIGRKKEINEETFQENPLYYYDIENTKTKRYSLPILSKKHSQSSKSPQPENTSIPTLPIITEQLQLKQTYSNVEKCLEDLEKIKNSAQKEVPKTTERILDLLLLSTQDLKKLITQQKQKSIKKIVQSKVPQDFFNILKQF